MPRLNKAVLEEAVVILEDVAAEVTPTIVVSPKVVCIDNGRLPTTTCTGLHRTSAENFVKANDSKPRRRDLLCIRVGRVEEGEAEYPEILFRELARGDLHIPVVRCCYSKIKTAYETSQSPCVTVKL